MYISRLACFLLATALLACTNTPAPQEPDEIMRKFDSVSHSLQKTNNSVSQSATESYKLLEKKLAGTDKAGSLQQFQYQVNDFYGYMQELKRRFYIACGDSSGTALPPSADAEDAIGITNRFFEKNESAWVLLPQLESVQKAFRTMNRDTVLAAKIDQLTAHPGKEFNKGWFYNVPPVAAITMLNKFENDVRNVEQQILGNLLAAVSNR